MDKDNCGCRARALGSVSQITRDDCRFPAVVAELEAAKDEILRLAIARDREFWREYADAHVRELLRSNGEFSLRCGKLEQERDALAGAALEFIREIAEYEDAIKLLNFKADAALQRLKAALGQETQ